MYNFEVIDSLDKKFSKISKKDKEQIKIISRKIQEVIKNPNHYKNLKAPLQHLKRVNIGKSFVLVFEVDENTNTVIFKDYDHHDKIYKN